MNEIPSPNIMPINAGEPYTQDEPPGAEFRWLLKPLQVPGMCLGHVTLQGPIHKTPAAHPDWDQVYLILSGEGTIHLGDRSQPVSGQTVVVIPRNTRHSVELVAGQTMTYVFFNEYL